MPRMVVSFFYLDHKVFVLTYLRFYKHNTMTCSHVFPPTLSQSSLDFPVKMARDKTVPDAKVGWEGPHYLMASATGIPGGGQAARAWPQVLPDQGGPEGTKASMKVSQPEIALSSDPAKHCTVCQSPFGK